MACVVEESSQGLFAESVSPALCGALAVGADSRVERAERTGLLERARSIIEVNLFLRHGESLIVVADEPTEQVGRLFYDAARAMGCSVQLVLMPEGDHSGEEPPAAVAAAMRAADVALCATRKSLTHTLARIEAAAAGTRVVTMPGVAMSMLEQGATCADYRRVEALTSALTERLSTARSARIEKGAHVLELSLEGRAGVASPGVYREPGACGNFPSGEAYIAPVETAVSGAIEIDGSMVGIGMLESPLVATIEGGRLVRIDGADARGPYAEQLSILLETPENATVAELGIGTNESAVLCGVILEDEKVYGTVHVAFGTNTSFGGVNKAACHYDGIVLNPTLYLDDELIIDGGKFAIS